MSDKDFKSILIIGMTGGLAQITAGLLIKKYPNAKIIGIDSRHTDQSFFSRQIDFRRMKYTRGNFEKLFRNHEFDLVLHLGRISHVHASKSHFAERLDLNIMGTSRILDLSLRFGVKKIIILSTFHVYGAYPDNSIYLPEDSPLRASIIHPELLDVVDMDQIATNWMWKNQTKIETIVFRPCNIIGPQIKNAMSLYLRTPYAPVPIDYNPMVQYIHEFDMANIIAEGTERLPTGIYNVATDEIIALKKAKKMVGVPTIPAPLFLLTPLASFINKNIRSIPDYLIDYLKYSCLISNSELKKHFPEDIFRFTTKDALELIRIGN